MGKSIKYRLINTNKEKLTDHEKKILEWVTVGDVRDDNPKPMTVEEMADKNKSSQQAIRKTIKRLKEKGVLKPLLKEQEINEKLIKQMIKAGRPHRGHALSFSIKILSSSSKYENQLKKKKENENTIDGNNLQIYRNKITVYVNKDFWGEDIDSVMWQVQRYTNEILVKLQSKYELVLTKPNNTKIQRFRLHIADVRSKDAEYIYKQGKSLKIKDKDGIIRVVMDNSFIPEKETVSSKHSVDDAYQLEKHTLSDLDPESMTSIELTRAFKEMSENNLKLQKENINLRNQVYEMSKQINLFIETSNRTQQTVNDFIKINTMLKKTDLDISEKPEDKDLGNYFM